jgi:hypothetical protein
LTANNISSTIFDMYRRPKFLEMLHEIREEMSGEADYDVDLFAENVRRGKGSKFSSDDSQAKDFPPPERQSDIPEIWKLPLKQ